MPRSGATSRFFFVSSARSSRICSLRESTEPTSGENRTATAIASAASIAAIANFNLRRDFLKSGITFRSDRACQVHKLRSPKRLHPLRPATLASVAPPGNASSPPCDGPVPRRRRGAPMQAGGHDLFQFIERARPRECLALNQSIQELRLIPRAAVDGHIEEGLGLGPFDFGFPGLGLQL